VVNLVAKEGF